MSQQKKSTPTHFPDPAPWRKRPRCPRQSSHVVVDDDASRSFPSRVHGSGMNFKQTNQQSYVTFYSSLTYLTITNLTFTLSPIS